MQKSDQVSYLTTYRPSDQVPNSQTVPPRVKNDPETITIIISIIHLVIHNYCWYIYIFSGIIIVAGIIHTYDYVMTITKIKIHHNCLLGRRGSASGLYFCHTLSIYMIHKTRQQSLRNALWWHGAIVFCINGRPLKQSAFAFSLNFTWERLLLYSTLCHDRPMLWPVFSDMMCGEIKKANIIKHALRRWHGGEGGGRAAAARLIDDSFGVVAAERWLCIEAGNTTVISIGLIGDLWYFGGDLEINLNIDKKIYSLVQIIEARMGWYQVNRTAALSLLIRLQGQYGPLYPDGHSRGIFIPTTAISRVA